jgi:hypothetical protein
LLHAIKTKKDNDLPKVAPRQQEVLRRENALKARQGGRFEFTANKLFKFHDVIARLHVYYGDGATERTKNVHCAQIED